MYKRIAWPNKEGNRKKITERNEFIQIFSHETNLSYVELYRDMRIPAMTSKAYSSLTLSNPQLRHVIYPHSSNIPITSSHGFMDSLMFFTILENNTLFFSKLLRPTPFLHRCIYATEPSHEPGKTTRQSSHHPPTN